MQTTFRANDKMRNAGIRKHGRVRCPVTATTDTEKTLSTIYPGTLDILGIAEHVALSVLISRHWQNSMSIVVAHEYTRQ